MTSEPITATAPPARGPDLLDLAWRYAGSSAATAALLALAAATLAAAAIFPQQPAGLNANTAEHWLTATEAGYGAAGPALRALGAFTILGGTWLRIMGALLAYHLLLRLAGYARYAWQTLQEKAAPLPPARLKGQAALLPIGAEPAAELAARVLAGPGGTLPDGALPGGTVPGVGVEAQAGEIRAEAPAVTARPGPALAQAAGHAGARPGTQATGQANAAVFSPALARREGQADSKPPAQDKNGGAAAPLRNAAPEGAGAPDRAAPPDEGPGRRAAETASATLPGRMRAIALRSRGYRVARAAGTGEWQVLYGQRRGWASVGPLFAYLGCLLVLLGLLLDDTAGWSVDRLALAQGMAAPEPAGTPATGASWLGDSSVDVRLDQIAGPERDPFSTLSLQRPGGAPASLRVGLAAPALWGNLWLVQRETGPALSVAAQDDSGHEVVLQPPAAGGRVGGSVRVLFTSTQTEQVFAAPARNLAFRAVVYPALPERGITQTVFLVEAYRGTDTTPALSQLIRGQARVTLDNVTYTFQEDRHAVFSMSYVPGAAPLALGGLLILAGAAIGLWWRRAEAWISLAAEEAGTLVTVRARALLDGEEERARLVGLLTSACEEART